MEPDFRTSIQHLSSNLLRSRGAIGRLLGASLSLCAGVELTAPDTTSACPVVYDMEESISLEVAPGKNAEVSIGGMSREADTPLCTAWVTVPLSAFPSTRLATRPSDVARSLRDVAEKMGAVECTIMVMHQNDTREEIAEHELCLSETFRFGERKVWSSEPESFCWEPSEEELVSLE